MLEPYVKLSNALSLITLFEVVGYHTDTTLAAQARAAGDSQNRTEPPDARRQSVAALRNLGITAYAQAFQNATFEVQLDNREITDTILKHLSNLPGARIKVTVPGAGFRRLDDLPDLRTINVGDPSMTDKDLQAINGVRSVRKLNLDKARISDAGLAGLTRMTGLREISLRRTSITDDGLVALEHMPNLESVYLGSAWDRDPVDGKVIGPGLAHLAGLQHLRVLDLTGMPINDEGLRHLTGLKSLHWLSLTDTRITSDGLRHLKQLGDHSSLYLENTRVTDAGLEHLHGVNFKAIGLGGTQVTNAGVEHLKDMTNLSWLDLNNTDISDASFGLPHESCALNRGSILDLMRSSDVEA